jgi:CubicO group peptidase (beta-lactamase class C family)
MSFIPRIAKTYAGVTFTNEEIRRYGRHLIMPEVTLEGQQKLKAARASSSSARADSARPSSLTWPRRAWGISAWSISTRSIFPTCTGRSSTRRATWANQDRFPPWK